MIVYTIGICDRDGFHAWISHRHVNEDENAAEILRSIPLPVSTKAEAEGLLDPLKVAFEVGMDAAHGEHADVVYGRIPVGKR